MIRAATADDLDAIMLIERRSFPTDAWSVDVMAAELASPHGRYLVDVESGGTQDAGPGAGAGREVDAAAPVAATGHETVVGYGGVRALRGSADSDIQTIAFDAAHRGSGRGRALLRALLAAADERGATTVFLEVRADNPIAAGLYRSEGFAEIGRRAGYYQPDDVDAVIMQLDLRGWNAVAEAASSAAQDDRTDATLQDDVIGSVLWNGKGPVDVTAAEAPEAAEVASAAQAEPTPEAAQAASAMEVGRMDAGLQEDLAGSVLWNGKSPVDVAAAEAPEAAEVASAAQAEPTAAAAQDDRTDATLQEDVAGSVLWNGKRPADVKGPA